MKYPYVLLALCLSSCQSKVINLNDDFDILKSLHSFLVLKKIENWVDNPIEENMDTEYICSSKLLSLMNGIATF